MTAEGGGAQVALDLPRAEGASRPENSGGDLCALPPGPGEERQEIGQAAALRRCIAAKDEEHPLPAVGNDGSPAQRGIAFHVIGAIENELDHDLFQR